MKRFVVIMLALLLMIPTGITVMAANTEITSVNLPVSETDFWVGSAITSPVFYPSLECVVGGKVTTLNGFTWECENYKSDTSGTYVFSAVAPTGYTFVCEVPTIKVNMKSGTTYHHTSYYMARDYLGQHVSVIDNVFCDRTGFNQLLTSASGEGLCLVSGIDYKRTMTESATANVLLDNTTITSLHAGSFGTNFKGTSNIYVNGGAITKGLYAGSVNGTFEGISNIYLSGAPVIKTLSCGGHYEVDARTSSNGSIVGSNVVTYDGTVNIYIADDYAGTITTIDTADAEQINFYISSGAEFDLSRYQISEENINVYIDGVNYDVVTDVEYNGADFVVADLGTAQKDVIKDSITVHAKGKATVLSGITWESANYSATKTGVYTFEPVLPAKYILADGVELPSVEVLVANSGEATLSSVSYVNKTVIPDGVALSDLDMPDTVSATFTLNSKTYTYDIPATFTSNNYLPEEGTYSFVLSVDDVFSASSLPSMSVEVSTSAEVTKSGDVYEINSAPVRISGEERGNYKITDVAGIHTYYDKVDVISAIYVNGSGVELVIDSDVVYVENKIDLNGMTGTISLEIPNALVTRVRYASSIAKYVYINGVCMSTYTSTSASADTSNEYIFANGVPSVIAKGDDGGTYLYRANDMSLLYSRNIEGWNAWAGGKSGTTLEYTNLAFVSGYIKNLYGGGKGDVYDATVVLDGGSVSYLRGAGISGTKTLHTTMVIESGQEKEYIIGGGESGSVTGDSTKTYADDEYSIEMHVYGGSFINVYLGSSGTVYGNVNLIQHGGRLSNVISSGTGTVRGNVDATVYDGMWGETFERQNVSGDITLRLYKGILIRDRWVYPRIEGDDITVTFFAGEDDFEFVRYIHDRNSVTSTDGDAGKLVIRFLETRHPGEDKYKYRYYGSKGDCMYITFPNGQNMLMDAGQEITAPLIIATLKELGVTKLDYVLITHSHNDHYGGLAKVAGEFPIGTFIIQDQISVLSAITNATEKYGSTILRLNRYESLTIGGVELYALNPKDPIQSNVNIASMATLLTYGESKILLGADTYLATEDSWLADQIIAPKIADCDLLKLGHHGYPTSNGYKYVNHVNPGLVAITTPAEHSGFVPAIISQLTDGNGINRNNIYVTGMNGLIKFSFDGTDAGTTVETEYTRILPYYADYSEVESVIEDYNSFDGTLSKEEVQQWEEAVSLVKYNLPYEEQNVVDGMSEHLEDVFYQITAGKTITATDMTGLVTKTVFPAGKVTKPEFYPTIPATVDGKEVDLPVMWKCDKTYDGSSIGTTYTFTAVADGYVWKCATPTIAVKVVNAEWQSINGRAGFTSEDGTPVSVVVRGDSGISDTPNNIYDATGCNVLKVNLTKNLQPVAAAHDDSSFVSVEGYASKGDTNVIVNDATVPTVFGGGHIVAHSGDTYVTVNNVTLTVNAGDNNWSGSVYGGGYYADVKGDTHITFKDSSVATQISGSGCRGDVDGDAYIDVSGLVTIPLIVGGSYNAAVTDTVYVNIHHLAENSTIESIKRKNATNLVVYLDDTSADLLSVVENRDTDRNTQIYIDGVLYVPSADYSAVEEAIALIPDDLSVYTDDSVAAVNVAKNAVDYNLTGYDQETVNGYAFAIENAIANLEYKYVVEVGLSKDDDYVFGTKLVLVYTNAEGIGFMYDGVAMYDVSDAGYKYNGTEYTYVYGLVVESLYANTVEAYEEKVTMDTVGTAEKIDYTIPYDVNLRDGVTWLDIIVIYSVANHDEDIFVNEYMKQIIKADTNRDKVVDIRDATSVIAKVYGTTN